VSHGEVKQIGGKRVATPEYRSWQMMKNRTGNPNAQDYKYYGGRGIGVVKRWEFFNNFLRDMGRRPTPKHTLERRNVDLGYSKKNCYWATRKVQARNRTYCKLDMRKARKIRLEYGTGFFTTYQLAADYGVSQRSIWLVVRNRTWKEDR
jgi:hypothetical protein